VFLDLYDSKPDNPAIIATKAPRHKVKMSIKIMLRVLVATIFCEINPSQTWCDYNN